jgi:hypothetical protein
VIVNYSFFREEAIMKTKKLLPKKVIILIFVAILLEYGDNFSDAQQHCPPWAQQKLGEIQAQAHQAGFEYSRTGDFNTFTNSLEQIKAAISIIPKECVDQMNAEQQQPNQQNAKMQCQQLWISFDRCQQDWKFKTAGGRNPTYTCIRPTCSRY